MLETNKKFSNSKTMTFDKSPKCQPRHIHTFRLSLLPQIAPLSYDTHTFEIRGFTDYDLQASCSCWNLHHYGTKRLLLIKAQNVSPDTYTPSDYHSCHKLHQYRTIRTPLRYVGFLIMTCRHHALVEIRPRWYETITFDNSIKMSAKIHRHIQILTLVTSRKDWGTSPTTAYMVESSGFGFCKCKGHTEANLRVIPSTTAYMVETLGFGFGMCKGHTQGKL